MICTEEEASKKWCPMGVKAVKTYSPCFASKCMWWVWVQEGMRAEDKPKPPTHGCCGYTHR
jgi:hypothetical protein